MARPSPLVPALTLLLAPACGDDRGNSASEGNTSTTASTGPVDPTTGTTGTTEISTTTDVDPTTSGTGTSTTGTSTTDATTGEPLECPFTPGCHKPAPPAAGRGIVSDAPIGCDGPSFALAWSVGVQAEGLAPAEAPRAIPILADLDGDALADLFINMRKAGAGYVFHGNGDGTFQAEPALLTGGLFAGGWGGDLGDLDGDGDLDVLVGDHVRGGYAWLTGPGLSFSEATDGLPQPFLYSGAGLGDLDGDGLLDAIFGADQFNKGFRVAKNIGGASWTEVPGPSSAKATNVGHFQFADIDADGDLDVFAFGEGGAVGLNVYVFRNDGGSFTELADLAAGAPDQLNADPVQGSIGDVDCDGDIDIAAGGTIFLAGGGSWQLAATVDDAHISHLADMNGDGHLDLVTHDRATGLALYLGDGTGALFTPAPSGLPDVAYTFQGAPMDTAYGIDIADVGGDSALDIVRLAGFGPEFALEVWLR